MNIKDQILRKLTLFILINLLLLLSLTATPVSARAGGSVGSSSTTSSSTSSSNTDDDYYRGRGYNNYGHNRFSLLDFAFMGFFGFTFLKSMKRRRQENYVLPETYNELTPELNTQFEPFFYQVEDAWTKNDLGTLKTLMSPHYFAKQKRIINVYIRNNKVDHLDGLVIIDLQQVIDPPNNKTQVIVTAQARDYFQYSDKTEQYNQQLQDDTNIERFKEIWTLKIDGNQLQLCDIKVIS